MNKKRLLSIIFVFIILLVVTTAFVIKNKKMADAVTDEYVNIVQIPIILTTEMATLETTETKPILNGSLNPLTGLLGEVDLSDRRPIVVMLDNQYYARPQAALSQADIVYEILVEGLITRYMAVFYGVQPEHIGPVRSSRPYFVEKAYEFDPLYVHVGGSMQALSDIKKLSVADIDGLSSGAFWREKHKIIPHNMYTSSELLLKDSIRLRYNPTVPVKFLAFNDAFTVVEGENASEITFVYKESSNSDKIGYYTSYKYNDDEKVYYRYTNGEPHVDENSNDQLTCSNILVQYAKTTVLDNVGRLDVDLITSGKGRYYSAGKYMEVTWSKESVSAATEFFDLSGNPIKLNPGVTWFQITKTGNVETIK